MLIASWWIWILLTEFISESDNRWSMSASQINQTSTYLDMNIDQPYLWLTRNNLNYRILFIFYFISISIRIQTKANRFQVKLYLVKSF